MLGAIRRSDASPNLMALLLVSVGALLAPTAHCYQQVSGVVSKQTLNYRPTCGGSCSGECEASCFDLYQPDPTCSSEEDREHTKAPKDTVILLHGGLWFAGDKEELEVTCRNIVSKAAASCVSMNYRLSGAAFSDANCCDSTCRPQTIDDELQDVLAAMRYVKANAASLKVNAKRMYIGGHSAGGHLSALLALRWNELVPKTRDDALQLDKPKGFIGLEGIYDLKTWLAYQAGPRWGNLFECVTHQAFGRPTGPSWESADTRSPTYLGGVANLKPVAKILLIQSPGDDYIVPGDAAAFAATLPGGQTELKVGTSCGIGQHNDVLREQALADCIIDFL